MAWRDKDAGGNGFGSWICPGLDVLVPFLPSLPLLIHLARQKRRARHEYDDLIPHLTSLSIVIVYIIYLDVLTSGPGDAWQSGDVAKDPVSSSHVLVQPTVPG
jgi:hypothetical protein